MKHTVKEWVMNISDKVMKRVSIIKLRTIAMTIQNNKKKVIWLSLSILLLLVIIFWVVINTLNHPSVKVSHKTIPEIALPKNDFSDSLNDITLKLANLENKLSSNGAVINIQSIESDLKTIQEKSEMLAKGSNDLMKTEIKHSNAQLSKKLDVLNEKLVALEAEKKQIKYLKPTELPYQVISVDNIQEKNIVTVSYDHSIFPMDVGDYLASWKLISADFVSQKAEFINKKTQHVVVDLNRITKRQRDE